LVSEATASIQWNQFRKQYFPVIEESPQMFIGPRIERLLDATEIKLRRRNQRLSSLHSPHNLPDNWF